MKIKTRLRAGFDLGQEVGRAVRGVAAGTRDILNGVGQAATPVVDEVGRTIRNPRFWTWPFNSGK